MSEIIDISTLKLPTGGIFKQECEVSAKLKLTPVTLVYQGLQEFFDFKIILLLIRFVHHR